MRRKLDAIRRVLFISREFADAQTRVPPRRRRGRIVGSIDESWTKLEPDALRYTRERSPILRSLIAGSGSSGAYDRSPPRLTVDDVDRRAGRCRKDCPQNDGKKGKQRDEHKERQRSKLGVVRLTHPGRYPSEIIHSARDSRSGCTHPLAESSSGFDPLRPRRDVKERGACPVEDGRSAPLAADAALAPVDAHTHTHTGCRRRLRISRAPPTERSQAVRLNLSYGLSIPHG